LSTDGCLLLGHDIQQQQSRLTVARRAIAHGRSEAEMTIRWRTMKMTTDEEDFYDFCSDIYLFIYFYCLIDVFRVQYNEVTTPSYRFDVPLLSLFCFLVVVAVVGES
jgi:hypothetical protein